MLRFLFVYLNLCFLNSPGVFSEVATPLLFDIIVEYLNGAVIDESLSSTNFSTYFNGSELVVSGLLSSEALTSLPIRITAVGSNGAITTEGNVDLTVCYPIPTEIELYSEYSIIFTIKTQ